MLLNILFSSIYFLCSSDTWFVTAGQDTAWKTHKEIHGKLAFSAH